jgi:hypothetical protein
VDYGYTKLKKICTQNKKIDCHLVDTRPVNPSKPADGDHIHPDDAGYKALAGTYCSRMCVSVCLSVSVCVSLSLRVRAHAHTHTHGHRLPHAPWLAST